tara:strand:- start:5903 stop:6328 length:426 start_codon:yes stop_codon:yes gene_type:complete
MDGKELKESLEKLDVSMDEFARSIGVKESTMRVCVYGNRVTKKMEAEINRMLGERARVGELEEIGEMIEDVVAPVREVEKRVRDAEELIGRVYLKPRNPYRYDVEFPDGSHGWFRAKPNKYFIGDKVKLKKAESGWEVVRG